MMLQLPVADQSNNLNELVEANQFDNMGISTNETSIRNLFVIGTEEKPIKKNLSLELPELSADLGAGMSVEKEGVYIDNGSRTLPSITLQFPDMTFGNTGNILTFSISNITGNQIDDINIELWDKNANRTNPLDTISFKNLTTYSSKELILNNKIIKENNLELKISYNQSSGPTTADFTISGLKNITIKKVENLEVTDVDTPTFEDLTAKLGVFDSIETYKDKANLKLAINEPKSMNMNFKFSKISIAGIDGEDKEEYFQWTESTDTNTEGITLGDIKLNGAIELPDDNIINYDATDFANVNISIIGKASYNSTEDQLPEELKEIEVEDGDLIYKTEPMEVDISQEEIDTMQEGIIDLDETYLETVIDNNTEIDLAAEVYIGSDKDNMYTSDNKVNKRILEVKVNDNVNKRFLLKNALDKVKETLIEGKVYLGIKFIAGDLDLNTGTDINFTDNMSISLKSSIFVKVRINQ